MSSNTNEACEATINRRPDRRITRKGDLARCWGRLSTFDSSARDVTFVGMIVELINTGAELLLGRVLNSHQQWLGRRFADLGYIVARQVTVSDAASEIERAVREALSRADLIIITGGLGPTSDDVTRDVVARLLGKQLRED